MKNTRTAFWCLAGGVATVLVATAPVLRAQASSQEVRMEEMMARMAEAAKPGPRHEALGAYVGNWDVEIAMVMPGSPGQKSKATAAYGWVIDGRWLSVRIDGQLMGQTFESFSIMGYDNYAKNHVVVTVSSMDTAMTMARGLVVDPTHKVRSLYGTIDEYTTGEIHKPVKVLFRDVSADRHIMEIWDLGIGDAGAKVLEYTFTRRR
jgi:hypothetical protein